MNQLQSQFSKKIKYEINIGLGDKNTKVEIERAENVITLIENYMKRLEIGYSIGVGEGGALYTDGKFSPEHSIYIIMIDGDYEKILQICRALKMFLNQEAILLTRRDVEVTYI